MWCPFTFLYYSIFQYFELYLTGQILYWDIILSEDLFFFYKRIIKNQKQEKVNISGNKNFKRCYMNIECVKFPDSSSQDNASQNPTQLPDMLELRDKLK